MSAYQACLFLLIVTLVSARTLLFKSVAHSISPNLVAWAIGSGTFFCAVMLFPFAYLTGHVSTANLFAWQGIAAGMAKGFLLTVLLVAQQRLITKSLSATVYVFPVAIGLIGALDVLAFDGAVTIGGMFSITILGGSGIAFALFGHLGTMDAKDKKMFATMVAAVVGFACCDRIGIPASGWYTYLGYTGLGNMISALLLCGGFPKIKWQAWIGIAICWSLPELFFNYAISGGLPISYGYMAIGLRVPILMLVAVVFFKEGRPKNQIIFGFIALTSIVPAFL